MATSSFVFINIIVICTAVSRDIYCVIIRRMYTKGASACHRVTATAYPSLTEPEKLFPHLDCTVSAGRYQPLARQVDGR